MSSSDDRNARLPAAKSVQQRTCSRSNHGHNQGPMQRNDGTAATREVVPEGSVGTGKPGSPSPGGGQQDQPIHGIGKKIWNKCQQAPEAASRAANPGASMQVPNNVEDKSTDARDQGISWRIISPDLTSNDPKKMEQAKSGGLTVDATGAEAHCTILAISPSAADRNVIYVTTDDGRVHVTKDGGKSWSMVGAGITGIGVSSSSLASSGAWVPYIWTNPKNAAEAWVVVNNYRQNDWLPYVYTTKDFGSTWTRKVTADGFGNSQGKGDKITGYVLSVLPDFDAEGLVFLGTDHGLYVSVDGGLVWNKWKGFPSVPVADLKIQARERDLVLGTFGRGIWVFDDIAVLRKFVKGEISGSANGGNYLSGPLVGSNNLVGTINIDILHAGDGVLARYKQPSGARFSADEAWSVANKPYGAMLDLKVVAEKDVKSGDWKKLDCVGKVYNEGGKLIVQYLLIVLSIE